MEVSQSLRFKVSLSDFEIEVRSSTYTISPPSQLAHRIFGLSDSTAVYLMIHFDAYKSFRVC